MKVYSSIFFDLDRTIWDFDASADDSFNRMFIKYGLEELGVPSLVVFREHYERHNDLLWSWYRKGEILKEVLNIKRFEMTLADFGISDTLIAVGMSEDYVTVNPEKAFLFPGAIESLEYLSQKYPLHLITNGFQEVQEQKFRIARLYLYFKTVTTSEEAGIKKPEPGIFNFAMEKANCTAEDSIYIGDDLAVDVTGALNVGMDQAFFNEKGIRHKEKVTFEIKCLTELMEIF
ncbi:MAG: noncanonical pyrimidine nucleotidase, YjjG family [Bacteroidetes bacterium]|nr:MAG: noncanonical pyrimidine nucleotidase, YjjG family [Bacteroidota bacterium]